MFFLVRFINSIMTLWKHTCIIHILSQYYYYVMYTLNRHFMSLCFDHLYIVGDVHHLNLYSYLFNILQNLIFIRFSHTNPCINNVASPELTRSVSDVFIYTHYEITVI